MTEEQYRNVLNNIAGSFGTLKDQINQAFEIGRALGLNDMQIGSDVRSKIKGLMSPSTIQRMLPETAKHKEFSNKPAAVKMTAKQPNIPPSREVVREAEIVREPPKPINEPLPISISIADNPLPPSKTIEVVFDPAPIDRDRTQVFIIEIDIVTKKVNKYKTVGRRTIR